jgi:hypothetical protein
MAEALDEPDFKISRHLRVLRSAGIVKTRPGFLQPNYNTSALAHLPSGSCRAAGGLSGPVGTVTA